MKTYFICIHTRAQLKEWPADQYEYVSGQLTKVWLALIGQLYFFIIVTYMYFYALQT